MIRVMHVGLGPIGALVARQIASRKGFRIVGAVDVDPNKVGRDVGDVIDAGRTLRVRVTDDIGRTIKAVKPDVAVLCTSSSLKAVLPQFEEVLSAPRADRDDDGGGGVCGAANRRLATRIDAAAKKAKVAVLGTGVNPGFTMDALPIALSAVCERVDRIEVHRVQDARIRRLPFQQKIGAGLTREQFARQVGGHGAARRLHESIQMIGDAMGWTLDRIVDDVAPKIAEQAVASELLAVAAGQVCGRDSERRRLREGRAAHHAAARGYLGAPDSYDSVLIEGSPRISSTIAGGVHGDIATASITVNSIPAVC
jgi:4-hydroxy-tetrahydrodipicolinate reductase